jgi:hypothetical protein
MRDVLVFTPVLRLEPETRQAIFSLEWDGPITILLQRDNPHFSREIRDRWEVDGTDELKAAHANVLHQYQRGQEVFLKGRYEAMLIIEHDVIPPKDTLKRLASLEADLAYGVYYFRGDDPVLNVFQRYYPWPQMSRNTGESLSAHPDLLKKAIQAGVTECSGGGLGCVLIRRRVLEETPFEAPKDPGYFDTEWVYKAHAAGYKMMADMRVVCGHKLPDGKILKPDFNHRDLRERTGASTENTECLG